MVAYTRDGKRESGFPASAAALERCRPVWRTFPGWNTSTRDARRWDDLPRDAQSYLEWIERDCGVPISIVSVGAERESEVARR